MKVIFTLIFALFCSFAYAQDAYVFTKEQHEQIRKNLQDYKILIKDYSFKSKQFDSLKLAFQLLKKLHGKQTTEFEEMAEKYRLLRSENVTLTNLTLENADLKKELESTKRTLEIRTHDMFTYKRKYEREHRLKRGDRILGNAVFGMFAMCGIMAVYIAYETNYGF